MIKLKKSNSDLYFEKNRGILLKSKSSNSRLHFEKNTERQLKCKRSQSEAVGFVIIILIVIIVGIIFFGISLRNKSYIVTEDAEITNFLASSLGITTTCYKDNTLDFRTIRELVKDCKEDRTVTCPNGKNACDNVKNNYEQIMRYYAPAGVLVYSSLSFNYQKNSDQDVNTEPLEPFMQDLVSGDKKKCVNKRAGREYINVDSGNLIVGLEICKV